MRTSERHGPTTRGRLRDALIELSLGRGYDRVTIRELAAAAGLHRGTFYQHYRDKDDLLLRCMDEIHEQLRAQIDGVDPELVISERVPLPLGVLLAHAAEHRAFYRWIFAAPLGLPFIERLRKLLRDSADRRIGRLTRAGLAPRLDAAARAMLVATLIEALLGGLRWFVSRPDPPDPSWAADRLGRLLLRGALDLLGGAP